MAKDYGIKAILTPGDTNEHDLYTCPADTSFIGRLTICNKTASQKTYKVAVVHDGNYGYERYNYKLAASDYNTIDLTIGADDIIVIEAGTASALDFVLKGVGIS